MAGDQNIRQDLCEGGAVLEKFTFKPINLIKGEVFIFG
jgi:hypothetical protein